MCYGGTTRWSEWCPRFGVASPPSHDHPRKLSQSDAQQNRTEQKVGSALGDVLTHANLAGACVGRGDPPLTAVNVMLFVIHGAVRSFELASHMTSAGGVNDGVLPGGSLHTDPSSVEAWGRSVEGAYCSISFLSCYSLHFFLFIDVSLSPSVDYITSTVHMTTLHLTQSKCR